MQEAGALPQEVRPVSPLCLCTCDCFPVRCCPDTPAVRDFQVEEKVPCIAGHVSQAHCVVCTSYNRLAVDVPVASTNHCYRSDRAHQIDSAH